MAALRFAVAGTSPAIQELVVRGEVLARIPAVRLELAVGGESAWGGCRDRVPNGCAF
jgi:hypothetical protein